jgi:hypothetical protein
MADTTGIPPGLGIRTVGSFTPKTVEYDTYTAKGKPFGNKLRIGEIVHGVILSIPSEGEAVVRLPIGTLTASLHGKLKPGDSLFFKVQEIQPSLVLRVHSVNAKVNGKFLDSREIVRMLDLPDSSFYQEIISFLKNHKTTISRSDALLLHQSYSNLSEQTVKKIPLQNVFKALYFIQENNIPLTDKLFQKLFPSFMGVGDLEKGLADLEKLISMYPSAITDKVDKLLIKLKKGDIPSGKLLKFFAVSDDYDSLWSSLKDIVNDSSGSETPLKSSAENLLNILESRHYLNSLSVSSNAGICLLMPIIIEKELNIVELNLKQQSIEKSNKRSYQFSFTTDAQNLKEIGSSGILFNKSLNVSLISDKHNVREFLKKNIEVLKNALIKSDYIVSSISVSDTISHETEPATDNNSQPRISIVI